MKIACVLYLTGSGSTEPLSCLQSPSNQVFDFSPELLEFSLNEQSDIAHEMLAYQLEIRTPVLHLYFFPVIGDFDAAADERLKSSCVVNPKLEVKFLENSVHLRAVPNAQAMIGGKIPEYALDIIASPIQPLQLTWLEKTAWQICCQHHPFSRSRVFQPQKTNPNPIDLHALCPSFGPQKLLQFQQYSIAPFAAG